MYNIKKLNTCIISLTIKTEKNLNLYKNKRIYLGVSLLLVTLYVMFLYKNT